MANKQERHNAIRELVAARPVGSQEELRRLLRQRGWDVTQSTLSRDLHELRLARVPTGDGLRYQVADGGDAANGDGRTALDSLLPTLFDRLDGVGELLVLHTVVGGAQPVAHALDGEEWPDILGTIAGDDTILIVCRSAQARDKVARRLRTLAGK
jgi:transcriptional regulator of arginine metabolism